MDFENALLSPEMHLRLFSATCKQLGLEETDIARLPPMSYPDTEKLFDIAMFLRDRGPDAIRKNDLFPIQKRPLLDMIVDGHIDAAISMLEAAGGGPIYQPSEPLHRVPSVIRGGQLDLSPQ
ncbi:MAG: hypothetical protein P4M15_01430 [Alphaproteobacteria bacterium]|nr:hypothetical protein [Alphaproteobacteria bacterium]